MKKWTTDYFESDSTLFNQFKNSLNQTEYKNVLADTDYLINKHTNQASSWIQSVLT